MRQINLDESETTYQMLSTIGWAIFKDSFQVFLSNLEEEIDELNSLTDFLEREQYLGARKHLKDFISRFEAEITQEVTKQRNKVNEQSTARFDT